MFLAFLLFGMQVPAYSQQSDTSSLQLRIVFRQSSSKVAPSYEGNAQRINEFVSELRRLEDDPLVTFLPRITIRSTASPEGSHVFNDKISRKRAESLQSYLRDTLATLHLANAFYILESAGEDWQGLVDILEASDLPYASGVLDIIRNTPYWIFDHGRIVGGRKKALMDYKGGRVWNRMSTEVFPQLRTASIVTLSYTRARSLSEYVRELTPAPDTVLVPEQPLPEEKPEQPAEESVEEEPQQQAEEPVVEEPSKPILALKTNLLADAVTAVNLGIEVPIGQRFSVEANAYFPWWEIPSRDITMQVLAGAVQGKYWFGDRTTRKPLTGLNAGVYMGAGLFDLQWGKGMQGELFIMGGLGVGYAHEIARNLRLEYSLGLGYIRTDYREYEPAKGTRYGDIKVRLYPWEEKRFSGVMPTKATVSLVWTINSKKGGSR